ncbi:hypothetical protein XAPC_1612 [Xanthomonas citri pv. punicae str. LMG 859]|nr:hypothetical protein XAPC_1612 [Xanthomonas citri pv. punicae str. LMG 859]
MPAPATVLQPASIPTDNIDSTSSTIARFITHSSWVKRRVAADRSIQQDHAM